MPCEMMYMEITLKNCRGKKHMCETDKAWTAEKWNFAETG